MRACQHCRQGSKQPPDPDVRWSQADAVDAGKSASDRHGMRDTPGSNAGHSFANFQIDLAAAFATDFSGLDVERNTRADALGTKAFTQGERIHLSSGAPGVDSPEGRALLGHEATHVVQQRQGRVQAADAKNSRIVVDRSLEAEADAVGAQVARGEAAPAAMRGVHAPAVSGAAQGKQERAPIQMFGALEHKAMGDLGSQFQTYRWDTAPEAASGKRDINFGFTLTHGDIIMLSGDLFDARETDEDGNPIPDNLFQLARTPGNFGSRLGTQDEIMYAIYREKPNDPRFKEVCWAPGAKLDDGSPAPSVTFPLRPDDQHPGQPYFSEEIKNTVKMRYLNLAARNRDHFAAPEGEKSGGPKSGNRRSAGGSYRAMHETAVQLAVDAGQRGTPIDEAMAYEAAAQHYLTDAFSSGHIRTPTGSIKTHWDAIYPNFWESLKRFISHQMAVYMNEEWNAATILGTVSKIEGDVITTLEEKVAAYPAFGFERLVALATHDVDNQQGLKVINDLGERWTAYGDSQMKYAGKDDSQKRAIEAVELGIRDIREAYRFPMLVIDPLAALQVDGPGGRKYRAEQKMPRVDPEYETTELAGWSARDIDDLWDNEIRSGSGYTYGAELEKSAKSGDIADQLADMSEMIDPAQEVWKDTVESCERWAVDPATGMMRGVDCAQWQVYLGTLEPRDAFMAGVVEPIKSDTKGTLKRIINFNPSAGQAWFNEDDSVMEEIDRMETRDKKDNEAAKGGRTDHNSLKGLTLSQRATWIENIMDGVFSIVFEDEEERIVQIFETCPASDRPLLYRMIEGHDWEGDYVEGVFEWDDDLYNSLSGVELKKVRDLINEGR
jgi:hypothetical protein